MKVQILEYFDRLRPEELNKIVRWLRKNSDFDLSISQSRQEKLSSLAIVDEEDLANAVFDEHDLDFSLLCGEDDSEE